VLRFLSRKLPKLVTPDDIRNCRMVMTVVARNEADIIRNHLEFHLYQGVDFIVATDHISTDGTLEIFKEYERKGILHLIEERNQDFDQVRIVDRMGRVAVEELRADVVFHSDADEFWYVRKGSLKEEMLIHRFTDVLKTMCETYILRDQGGAERFPHDCCYKLLAGRKSGWKEKHNRLFQGYRYQCLLLKTTKGLPQVNYGNHQLVHRDDYVMDWSENLRVAHFLYRGKGHFIRKIRDSGASLINIERYREQKGRECPTIDLYNKYHRGELDTQYEGCVFTEEDASDYIRKNLIAEVSPAELDMFLVSGLSHTA